LIHVLKPVVKIEAGGISKRVFFMSEEIIVLRGGIHAANL
jgi:hypothetical protein